MADFSFEPHYVHDPYTGHEMYPDCIELRVGYNVIGRLYMKDLVSCVSDYQNYVNRFTTGQVRGAPTEAIIY